MNASPDDLDRICAALPHTELGTSWGDVPTWKVPVGEKGKGFVLYRKPHKSAIDPATGEVYDDLLVIRVANAADKQSLVASGGPFFDIEHFKNYNAVLVQQSRLGEVSVDELREIITDAWLAVAPKKLRLDFLSETEGRP